jgi:hypothetical protein
LYDANAMFGCGWQSIAPFNPMFKHNN